MNQRNQTFCHWSKLNGKVRILYKQSQNKTTRAKLLKNKQPPKQLVNQIISRKTLPQKVQTNLKQKKILIEPNVNFQFGFVYERICIYQHISKHNPMFSSISLLPQKKVTFSSSCSNSILLNFCCACLSIK